MRRSPRSTDGSELKVLIQNGEYWLANNGDLAMLDVTVGRLRRRWPTARIGVMTRAPWLLRAISPSIEPISAKGRGSWPRAGSAFRTRLAVRAGPQLVGSIEGGLFAVGQEGRRWVERLDRILRRTVRHGLPRRRPTRQRLPDAVREASLVLAMGGGYLADVDATQTARTLDLLEYAVDNGIPAAILGQGLGPLADADLLERARRVLPRIDLISLREDVLGPSLLEKVGVARERIIITGDDAVSLAYAERSDSRGTGIGICLRVAEYAPVAEGVRQAVAGAVQQVGRRMGAPLVPLIISEYRSEDRRTTLPLVEGYVDVVPPLGRFAGARKVARRVGECRVVVTGAYHLAVFALSQGIPVVGLSSSAYYDAKFEGLRAMFGGEGLTRISLLEPEIEGRLVSAIEAAWSARLELAQELQASARDQIEAGERAYGRTFDLVDGLPHRGLRGVKRA